MWNDNLSVAPVQSIGHGVAPSNIALIKYWGKRCNKLNLPNNDSLSISLGHYGAETKIYLHTGTSHVVLLNDNEVAQDSEFYQRIIDFLDKFDNMPTLHIKTYSNLPIAAGVASSAAGFAALVLALNDFFSWQLTTMQLSILARLGSGSAARSIERGFVYWHRGNCANGTDSYAELLDVKWPEFYLGLLICQSKPKKISSRLAMQNVASSPYYASWPEIAAQGIQDIKTSIYAKNFAKVGRIAEQNSEAMHALMMTSCPQVCYSVAETLNFKHRVFDLRDSGVEVYYTQDAGANLKLLFQQQDLHIIEQNFPEIITIKPFEL